MASLDNHFKEEAAAEKTMEDLQQLGLLPKDLEEPAVPEVAIQVKKMLALLHEPFSKQVREKIV